METEDCTPLYVVVRLIYDPVDLIRILPNFEEVVAVSHCYYQAENLAV